MSRSYALDIEATTAAQAGDSHALTRLLHEYTPNMEKMVRNYDGYLAFADGMDIARSALTEFILTATDTQASYLRNQVGRIVREAIEAELHPGISARQVAYCREALALTRQPIDPSDPPALTLTEAAATIENGLSAELLASFAVMDSLCAIESDEDAEEAILVTYVSPDIATSNSRHAHIEDAISALSPKQREVVTRFMDGMTDADIASDLGMGTKTVQTHRLRAFARLRDLIPA